MTYQTYLNSLTVLTREQYLAIALPTEADWQAYNRFLTPMAEWQWHSDACGVQAESKFLEQASRIGQLIASAIQATAPQPLAS